MSDLTGTITAILYGRVSTDEQADSGLGLDDQLTRLRGMAAAKAWHPVELIDDGWSAKTLDRPAMSEALTMLDDGDAGALVVAKLDRLTRDLVDLASLMRRAESDGWALVVLDLGIDTSTASGRLVANVMTSVSQWEREVIGERTSSALARKRARGERNGRRPELPNEIRRRIHDERTNQRRSYRAIAARLEADSIPTAHGGARWHASTVRAVVESVELDHELGSTVSK